MEHDVKCKRARFIGESTEIREAFAFAEPTQILQAVRVYCGHFYGSMLWDLQSEGAGMFYRSWNTCVKLAYNIPRSTHTYLVENYLAAEFTPIRTELMARYIKFYDSLLNSKSLEIQVLVNTITKDARSTTSRNLGLVVRETKQELSTLTAKKVRQCVVVPEIPINHGWRVPLLKRLLQDRREMELLLVNTSDINDMINSLCSS